MNDDLIERLSKYSVVFVEPRIITKNQVEKLKEKKAQVYGYTSIIEQNINNASFSYLEDSCFYKPDGNKIKHDKWESFYMDIRENSYQEFLYDEIKNEIINKNFDGVFFDTVGDIDDASWNEYDKLMMRRAYTVFLKNLKAKYKKLKIIQNWGINTAYKHSANFIDGLMWEGFSFELLNSDEWSIDRYREINEMNVDFYIVSRKKEEINQLKNKKTFVFVHDDDIYNNI